MQKLEYLAKHNIKGRILTTNYLNFTTPGSLSKLLEFPNIELRVYTKGGFHPKGYIFKQSNYYSMIIGSANLTASALSQNQEWSIKFLSLTDGQIVYSVREEFERVWNDAEIVTPDWIEDYKIDYNLKKVKLVNSKKEEIQEFQLENAIQNNITEQIISDEIVPNSMQQEAMTALAELREKNENRALLIAATTGLIEGCIGLFRVGYLPTITGTFDNPTLYAMAVSLSVPALLYFLNCNNKIVRYLIYICFAVLFVAIVLSESRTGILCMCMAGLFQLKRICKINFRYFAGICAILITLLLLFMLCSKKDSTTGRSFILSQSFEMIKDKPFGWGQNGFAKHYMDYQADFFRQNSDEKYAYLADNIRHPYTIVFFSY